MNDLQVFGFENKEVRVVAEGGQPWFVAKDVAVALRYKWNGKDCIAHVPEEWRGVRSVLTPSGVQQMQCLSEQGLYFFLGRSDKPAALPFQKLVAGTILPAIRKTGTYTVPGREWKEPSAARIKEIRMAYDKGTVTVNEYRRQAFNLPPFEIDAPLEKPARGRAWGAEIAPHPYLLEEPAYKSDGLIKFVDENLELTGNAQDYIPLTSLYERYTRENDNPLSRWSFTHLLKGSFNIVSCQKKINGYPAHVFIGCKFKAVREYE